MNIFTIFFRIIFASKFFPLLYLIIISKEIAYKYSFLALTCPQLLKIPVFHLIPLLQLQYKKPFFIQKRILYTIHVQCVRIGRVVSLI